MLIKMISGMVKNWGAPANWTKENGICGGLPARIEVHNDVEYWVSAWEPSPEELKLLNEGGSIHLGISTKQHPVVFLSVRNENNEG